MKILDELIRNGMKIRHDHIEMMAAAYFQKTDADPRSVELVEERKGNRTVWYFRERDTSQKIVTYPLIDSEL